MRPERPNGDPQPCSVCRDKGIPGCEHLVNVYDYLIQAKGWTEQDLIEYALNRQLALNRDNGNKREGILPQRRYKSNLDRADDARAKAKARLSRKE